MRQQKRSLRHLPHPIHPFSPTTLFSQTSPERLPVRQDGRLQRARFPSHWYARTHARIYASALTFVAGANREVKKAVEAYWAGKISADDLNKVASEVKKFNWTSIKERKVDFVPR